MGNCSQTRFIERAIANNNLQVVQLLLRKTKVDDTFPVMKSTYTNPTPLLPLTQQPQLNPTNPSSTPLKKAASHCSLDIIKELVKYGADPYPGSFSSPTIPKCRLTKDFSRRPTGNGRPGCQLALRDRVERKPRPQRGRVLAHTTLTATAASPVCDEMRFPRSWPCLDRCNLVYLVRTTCRDYPCFTTQ